VNVCTLACYTKQVFHVRHDSTLTPISATVGFVFTQLFITGVTGYVGDAGDFCTPYKKEKAIL